MRIEWTFILFFNIALINLPNVFAQSTSNIGGVIQPAGLREPYGISDTRILESQTYITRHRRLGQETGIGSSFLQTTSPTSESSPALEPTRMPITQVVPSFVGKPKSIYGNAVKTPALSDETGDPYAQQFSFAQERGKSPALNNLSLQSILPYGESDGLIKSPITITEPLQHLNLHKTGGESSPILY